jgi:hypothetical protein
MSTFGKVLAVLNVLAAIGFLVLAGMDYNKRQSWAYSYFRHQLALNGLPLDATDDSWRLPGQSISSQFGKDANKELFGGSGPTTQDDEVKSLVKALRDAVEQAPDMNAKRAIIGEHLLPGLSRAEDRDVTIRDLQQLKDQGGVDKLLGRFEGLAAKALNTQADRETRRRAIADFLYNFEYTPTRHQRVQNIVGLDQYVAAAERQTTRMRDAIARNRRVIADEQTAFVAQYQAIPPELNDLAGKLQTLETKLTEQKALVQKHEALRNDRMAEAMNLNRQLDTEKQSAAKEYAALAALQQELFGVQRDWAEAQARNQQLEQELRAKETGR